MKWFKSRSILRRKISKYPMSQRKTVRAKMATNNNKKFWRPSKATRKRIKKVTSSKTVRTGLVGAATVGTTLMVLPKETLGNVADTVQSFGETVYDMAEDMGETTGNIVKAVGVAADGLSNGIGFVAENFTTLALVGFGGWILNKLV